MKEIVKGRTRLKGVPEGGTCPAQREKVEELPSWIVYNSMYPMLLPLFRHYARSLAEYNFEMLQTSETSQMGGIE